MWKLKSRDHVVKKWSEHGDFKSIAEAVERINGMEGKPSSESLFLSVMLTLPAHLLLSTPMPEFSPASNIERPSTSTF